MGRLALILDAEGYFQREEEGFSARWTGYTLLSKQLLSNINRNEQGFWNPKASPWIMGRPLQLKPDWYLDARLIDHVLPKSKWAFAAGVDISTVLEWQLRRTPSEAYGNDQWMRFTVPSAGLGASPMPSVNFTTLAAAAGMEFPAGIGVAAVTNFAVYGIATPQFNWVQYPTPEDLFIFGFGQYALVAKEGDLKLLRVPDFAGDYDTWEFISSFGAGELGSELMRLPGEFSRGDFVDLSRPMTRLLMTIPVGSTMLYFMSGTHSEPWSIKVRDVTAAEEMSGIPTLVAAGPWWVAGYPRQKINFQAQTMGYDSGLAITPGLGVIEESSGLVNPPNSREWFNLGVDYNPLTETGHDQSPQLWAGAVWHDIAGGGIISTPTGSTLEYTTVGTHEYMRFTVVDESHHIWASDGTHHRGAIAITLSAAAPTNPALKPPSEGGSSPISYRRTCSPQFREIQLRFPEKIVALPATNLILDDTKYRPGWRASAHLHDPEGKSFDVALNSRGMAQVITNGLHLRHDYAVHLVEDVDENGTYETVRVRAWLVEPVEVEELRVGIYVGEIHAKGLLMRADERFMLQAAILNPLGQGYLEHTDGIRIALKQSGFNVDDVSKVAIGVDPATGSDPEALRVRRLPGAAGDSSGEAGEEEHPGWAPDWDETKLEWMKRVADQWRKWLLYEDLAGKVYYIRDPIDDILDLSATLPVSAVFYASEADANLFDEDPRRVYQASNRITHQRVESNVVRIIPQDPTLPQVVIRDRRSVEDPDSENYVGHRVRPVVARPKLAVNLDAAKQLAAVALLRLRRKKKTRMWRSRLAAWEVASGFDAGGICALDGDADYQVVKVDVEGLARNTLETTFVAERLPAPPVLP